MDKNIFSVRLAQILEEKGMKQAELCKRTGISKATISQYKTGQYKAKHDRIVKLAEVIGCNPLWLEGYNVDKDTPLTDISDDIREIGTMLPVLSGKLDENGIMLYNDVTGSEYARREWRDPSHFYIRMPDNSMEPTIFEGDLLLCERCSQMKNEEIGLFVIDNSTLFVRKYLENYDGITLVGINPVWPRRLFTDSERNGFRTEARVILCIHSFDNQ